MKVIAMIKIFMFSFFVKKYSSIKDKITKVELLSFFKK